MPDDHQFTINFQPIGRRIAGKADHSLLTTAQEAGIDIASICGGIGICDSCKIRLIKGRLTEPTLEEKAEFSEGELEQGYRLACQVYPASDLTVEIPPESLTAPQRLQIEGQSQIVELNPAVKPYELNIAEPTIADLRSDVSRLQEAIVGVGLKHPVDFPLQVLEDISTSLRKNQWHITLAMRNNSVVAVLPPAIQLLGLAIDIGTTKLAAYLRSLTDGCILAKGGVMNPQTAFGEDVISRISYSDHNSGGRATLQSRLVDALNQLTSDLCQQAAAADFTCTPSQIVDVVAVGNTAMHHLFAGLPVHQLGVAPYVPAVSGAMDFYADRVGLKLAPGSMVYMPPNIAGYVGADHIAMLLSTGAWDSPQTTIALDIGTNTEISLVHNKKIYACSCASGPAFEGAHIGAGMRAAPGAIERVQIIQGELCAQTIGNVAPVGICGSGILDAIACLHQSGVVDQRGSFISTHPLVRYSDQKREFVLVDHTKSGTGDDLVITRQDINEIQLAKGAIRTGIEVLLDVAGISADAIEQFIIAGAFGTYINIPSAIQIGMFPSLPVNRFSQVGNAAGAGACQMLLSVGERSLAEEIAKRVNYVELSTYPNFTTIFSKSLFLES